MVLRESIVIYPVTFFSNLFFTFQTVISFFVKYASVTLT